MRTTTSVASLNPRWSNEELAKLKAWKTPLTDEEIAREFPGRTRSSIKKKRSILGWRLPRAGDPKPTPFVAGPSILEEMVEEAGMEAVMSRARARLHEDRVKELEKTNKELARQQALDDRLIEKFDDFFSRSGKVVFNNPPPPPFAPAYEVQQGEVPLIVISDSHFGQIVRPEETNGFGHYNMLVAMRRAAVLRDKPIQLSREGFIRSTGFHAAFLGDLCQGMLYHCEEMPGREYIVDQVEVAAYVFYGMLTAWCDHFGEVWMDGLGGNHARMPNQAKQPTHGTRSNFDMMVLNQVRAMFYAANKDGLRYNIHFNYARGSDLIVEIMGHTFIMSHADELKGGDKALGIPAHSIGRRISNWTARMSLAGRGPVNYFLGGDKHRMTTIPIPGGQYLINGAWPGDDEYVLKESFSANSPSQMFFGVNERYGKSWSYDIYLDESLIGQKPLSELGFDLPEDLAEAVAVYGRI